MKNVLLTLLFGTTMGSLTIQSQDLSGLEAVAHYTMINTATDALGNFQDIELINAPFQDELGVYSNGNYTGTDPDSCLVRTPAMPALYEDVFAIQVEFKLDAGDGRNHAVLVCGDSWRYLGLMLTFDYQFGLIINDRIVTLNTISPMPDRWYTLTIKHNQTTLLSEYYLDDAMVGAFTEELERSDGDSRISNTHFGNGETHKGHWRNLKVYAPEMTSHTGDLSYLVDRIHVFPNPATDIVYLQTTIPGSDTWVLYNASGALCLSGNMTGASALISLERIPEGVYALSIFDVKKSLVGTRQLVITR